MLDLLNIMEGNGGLGSAVELLYLGSETHDGVGGRKTEWKRSCVGTWQVDLLFCDCFGLGNKQLYGSTRS